MPILEQFPKWRWCSELEQRWPQILGYWQWTQRIFLYVLFCVKFSDCTMALKGRNWELFASFVHCISSNQSGCVVGDNSHPRFFEPCTFPSTLSVCQSVCLSFFPSLSFYSHSGTLSTQVVRPFALFTCARCRGQSFDFSDVFSDILSTLSVGFSFVLVTFDFASNLFRFSSLQ